MNDADAAPVCTDAATCFATNVSQRVHCSAFKIQKF